MGKKLQTREERAKTFRVPKSERSEYSTVTYTYKEGPNCTVTAPKPPKSQSSEGT